MKLLLFFLCISTAVFSQLEKKKPLAVIAKSSTVKKPVVEKKNIAKTLIIKDKNKDLKIINDIPKTEIPVILNDTAVTITTKSISSAPTEEKQLSYDVAYRLLNSCNTSKLKKFTEFELTANLLKKITTNYISAICVNNNGEYGKFIGIELAEVLTNENILTNIYRYKIEYERKLLKKEMRIYINKEGLVSVIKSLIWRDNFELKKKYKPKPKKILDSLTIIDESFIIRN